MIPRPLFYFFLFFLFLSRWVQAGVFNISSHHTYGPLPVRTHNPLYLLFVAQELERPETLPLHKISGSIETTFSNLFERNVRPNGIGLDLDMELARTAFRVSYGLTNDLELGIEIPFLSFSGGFLDSFVQGYHNAFGFPNAGRGNVDNGRFSYLVTQNGGVLYQVDQADFRFSDLVLHQKLKVMDETRTRPALAVKSSLKLPTGSRTEGTGSGEVDFNLSLLAEKSYRRLHSYTGLGFLALGVHEDLAPIQKKGAVVVSQAFEFNAFEHLSVIGQIDFVSSIFQNIEIPELSKAAVDLAIGFTGHVFSKKNLHKIFYQAGFMEDVTSSGPSVDFTLFFNAGMIFSSP